jgi:hypothetical protein
MYLVIDPVARGRARRRRQHTVPLEIAHLLNGVPGTPRHIDGTHVHDLRPNNLNRLSIPQSRPQSLHKDFNATLEHMTMDEIISFVGSLGGVLTLQPAPGDGSPEISWGDTFFYYSPDGVIPTTTQPFATIVTKDYPGDEASHLDRPDAFRVNIAVGKDAFIRWTGHAPREPATAVVASGAADTVIAHPVYGTLGWLAVVNPGSRTEAVTRELLRTAHGLARARYERRAERTRPN